VIYFLILFALANILKPKVIVAENVKGMLIGNARVYTKKVLRDFENIGYNCQVFLLNAASMGVPQKRERVFFIASRKDLEKPKLKLFFNENSIKIRQAIADMPDYSKEGIRLTPIAEEVWRQVKIGKSADTIKNGSWYSRIKLDPEKVCNTITAKAISDFWHWKEPYYIAKQYIRRLSTFPEDYNNLDCNIGYLAGMSVPPIMMAQIANQIYLQWFKIQ
jgi:DNA (cytosine-5)-methyltransferase 1